MRAGCSSRHLERRYSSSTPPPRAQNPWGLGGDPIESPRQGHLVDLQRRDAYSLVEQRLLNKVRGPRGAIYTERYSRRYGYRVGRGARGVLVTTEPLDPADADQRRHLQRIDRLFRAWRRNRGDVATLRELHDAIAERLGVS
jgi:hypothetical protein